MTRKQYKGNAAPTALSSSITDTDTTITIDDGTNWPDGSVGPFVISIDRGLATEEKILCASRSGTTITVATSGRGYDETVASSHNSTAIVEHVLDADTIAEANRHANLQTTKGDLLIHDGTNVIRVPTGAVDATKDGQLLVLEFSQASGWKIGKIDGAGIDPTTRAIVERLHATSAADASAASTAHALQAGPTNGLNIIIDGNEIMARDNGAEVANVFFAAGGHLANSVAPTASAHLTNKGYIDGSGGTLNGGRLRYHKHGIMVTLTAESPSGFTGAVTLPAGFRPATTSYPSHVRRITTGGQLQMELPGGWSNSIAGSPPPDWNITFKAPA